MNVIKYGFYTIVGMIASSVAHHARTLLHALFDISDSACSISCKMLNTSIEMEYAAKGTANNKKIMAFIYMCFLSRRYNLVSDFISKYKDTQLISESVSRLASTIIAIEQEHSDV